MPSKAHRNNWQTLLIRSRVPTGRTTSFAFESQTASSYRDREGEEMLESLRSRGILQRGLEWRSGVSRQMKPLFQVFLHRLSSSRLSSQGRLDCETAYEHRERSYPSTLMAGRVAKTTRRSCFSFSGLRATRTTSIENFFDFQCPSSA